MEQSWDVSDAINVLLLMAADRRYEFVTPELLLRVLCDRRLFASAFENCGGSVEELKEDLEQWLSENIQKLKGNEKPYVSAGIRLMIDAAFQMAENCGKTVVELQHLIAGFYYLEESFAVYYMEVQGVERAEFLQELSVLSAEEDEEETDAAGERGGRDDWKTDGAGGRGGKNGQNGDGSGERGGKNGRNGDGSEDRGGENGRNANGSGNRGGKNRRQADGPESDRQASGGRSSGERTKEGWRRYVTCLNDALDQANPLIGREAELERTMQILCRKEKNNPLHVGEPGVGKTAIVYGLARLLNEGKVPKPLRGAKIYSLDLGGLLAGTQYRGDFEKRFGEVMHGISCQEKPIVYMDEIHNIVGAGAVGSGSFDISNMLKPYLSEGQIRFIGATTYEEYKKYFEKSKSLVRRFQNVDIKEPGIEDTVKILKGLKKHYESYHQVVYAKGVLEYAARMSSRYINERFLPDKAIDLLDEAGAFRRLHPLKQKTQTVGKDLIDEILSKTCQIPKETVESDETEKLKTLESRLSSRVFGQDEAVSQVVNAVKFSRAGLLEEGKPLASLLFVGPTGVGKTEIARSLADELGIRLIRFDMSEYEEKHAVAKLIGAPAGYVGYEEGGLLTEEIRKNPHCVLLLDEIEKAHPDIYNILLQVMDYATLTDNQGRKADFRNCVVIMTSNAGASRVGKTSIGFGDRTVKADAIMEEVKKTFQPEFRNRLTRIVVFRPMDQEMAARIVDKKLGELQRMLERKKVVLTVTQEARELIRLQGVSEEYGAREIERVIGSQIKPLLVDELLFGRLKRGGSCTLDRRGDGFVIEKTPAKSEKGE